LIAKIEVFWIWLGDLVEITGWLILISLFSLAIFMISYSFNDFSNNLNNRNIMKGNSPFKKRKYHKSKK